MIDHKELVKDPKEWFLERITSSRCLCVGPCFFQFLNVEPTSTQSDVLIKVFDGQNDQGEHKVSISCLYGHGAILLPQPAYFRRGLYVDLTTNAGAASVQYLPLKD